MKNFFKKVAFVLALAMVLTNIGPAASASAAEAPGLKYSSYVIYLDGGSAFNDYNDYCWIPTKNPTEVKKAYKVTYDITTGKNLISVGGNGKVIATGNGIGKAIVKVTYTPDGGGQVITANFTVKVRRNATAVKIRDAVAAKLEEPLTVGAEISLTSAKSITNPVSWKTGDFGVDNYMTVCSDQIAYEVSDDKVIDIKDGKLIAVGNGTATLTVYTYEYGDKDKIHVLEKPYQVTVVGGIVSAKQTHINKLELVMSQNADLGKSDFVITRGETKITVPIKDITAKDKIVTIETFYNMVKLDDMEKYEIKYTRKDEDGIVIEDDIQDFEVTNGIVTNIGFNKDRIQFNTPTKITALLKDVSGVILNECTYTEYVSGITKFSINLIDTRGNVHGYTSGDDLILDKVGNYADIEVVYESYSNNTNEKAKEIKGSVRIIATEQTPVAVEDLVLTINNNTNIDWSAATNKNICVKDDGYYVHVLHKDTNGKDLTHEKGYILTSSNSDVLVVGGTVLSFTSANNSSNGIYADIFAVKEGTANIIVRDAEGKLISIVPVTVRPERTYSRFELDNTSFTVSNSPHIENDHVKTVNIKFKDQYGDDYTRDETYRLELVSKPANGSDIATPIVGYNSGTTIVFNPINAEPGTYTYRISRGNMSRTITINVRKPDPNGKVTYELIRDGSLNLVYNSTDDSQTSSVAYKVGIFKNGVLYEYSKNVDVEFFTINGADKTYTNKYTISGSVVIVPLRTTETITGGVLIKKADKGIYSIRIKENTGGNIFRDGFNVTDTQNPMTAKVIKLTAAQGSIDDVIKQVCEFYYTGEMRSSYTVVSVESTNFPNATYYTAGNQVYVRNVTIRYAVTSGVYVDFIVSVNRTITITN